MSQSIKISDNEISEIRMLQNKFQEITIKMGLLQGEKWELDRLVNDFMEREKKLREERNGLQKMEENLLDKIVKSYGEGNLDMATGTFIPSVTTTTK